MNRMIIFLLIFHTVFSSAALLADDDSSSAQAVGTTKKPRVVTITRETMRERKYKLLPLKSINYDTVQMMVKPLLTDKGLMTYEAKRNSILIYDYPENIAKIQKFLEETDRDAVNIRIDVDYVGSVNKTKSGLDVGLNYGGKKYGKPQLIVKDGKLVKPKSVKIDPYHQTTTTSRRNSTFIMTQSGYPASLWAGKTIVDPSWKNNFIYQPTIIQPNGNVIEGSPIDYKWADVGASLDVLPTYMDNGLIHVELYPRLSYLDGKGKRQAVKVESLSTKLTVKEGQRINIGGLIEGNKKNYIKLFGPDFFRRDDISNVLNMYLTATVVTPGAGRTTKSFHDVKENPWKFNQ